MSAPFLHILQETFAKHAARPALVHAGRTWTYAELDEQVRSVAVSLEVMDVAKGDRVVLCTSDKLSFLIGHLATLFAGAVSLPLNSRFTREELKFFLNDSSASVAVVDLTAWRTLEAMRAELPNLKHIAPGAGIFGAPASRYRAPTMTGADPCMIIYSSGTTGWPKGVVHTHANIAAGLQALGACWRFTPDDVVLNVLPLFHVHGLCFATQLTLMSGGCVILDEFDPQRTLTRINECSVFMAVPTIYYRFLEQSNFRDSARTWTKPRLFTCGSAPIRAEVLPELEAILGKPVINRYGMTEAFVITSLPLEGPWPYGSVGKPLDGVEVRVINEPNALATDVGAVQIRGLNLFREYWTKPDATRDAFSPLPLGEGPGVRAGWFDTGDLGSLDANGFLTLVGRKNDLIITSGFNVYPQVVERVINECPGVRESVVLGVPDNRKGERVVTFVVRDDVTLDEARLNAYLAERLVDYQRPKTIAFMDALPRNAMGKVLRRELRDAIMGETK